MRRDIDFDCNDIDVRLDTDLLDNEYDDEISFTPGSFNTAQRMQELQQLIKYKDYSNNQLQVENKQLLTMIQQLQKYIQDLDAQEITKIIDAKLEVNYKITKEKLRTTLQENEEMQKKLQELQTKTRQLQDQLNQKTQMLDCIKNVIYLGDRKSNIPRRAILKENTNNPQLTSNF